MDDKMNLDCVYLVELVGIELYHLYGIYSTYEKALSRWQRERKEKLEEYVEYKRLDDEEGLLPSIWGECVYIYSAETPEEFEKRLNAANTMTIDAVQISKHTVI